MGPLLIRAGSLDDAPAVSAVAYRAKAGWGYPVEWLDAWHDVLTVAPDYLAVHHSWIATRGSDVVGSCVLEVDGARASLNHVWVIPEAQRQGVGRALVEAALASARVEGVLAVDVESDPHAEPFYLRLGARRCGQIPAPMPGAPDRVLPLLRFHLSP
jgi:GNAT superfamily N-acetyltransferase